MDQDYRSVFVAHLPLNGAGTYRSDRQRNPWSYTTLSAKAFVSALVKDLQKTEGGMDGLYLVDGHYRSEHLDKVGLDSGSL